MSIPLPPPTPKYNYFPFREVGVDLKFVATQVDFERLSLLEDVPTRPLDPARVQHLSESIAAYGRLLVPLMVYPRGGRYWILDGQHRYAALRALQEQGLQIGRVDVLEVNIQNENASYAALAGALTLNLDQHGLSPLERGLAIVWYLRVLFSIHASTSSLDAVMSWLTGVYLALRDLPADVLAGLEESVRRAPPTLDGENALVAEVVDEIIWQFSLPTSLRPLFLLPVTRGLFYWAEPLGGLSAVTEAVAPLLDIPVDLLERAYTDLAVLRSLEAQARTPAPPPLEVASPKASAPEPEAPAPEAPPPPPALAVAAQPSRGGPPLDLLERVFVALPRRPDAKVSRGLALLLRQTRPLYRRDPEVRERVSRILEESYQLFALLKDRGYLSPPPPAETEPSGEEALSPPLPEAKPSREEALSPREELLEALRASGGVKDLVLELERSGELKD